MAHLQLAHPLTPCCLPSFRWGHSPETPRCWTQMQLGPLRRKKKWSPLSHGCWTKYFLIELHPSLQGWASEQAAICTRACGCTLVMDNPQAGWTSLMEILLMRTGVDQTLLPRMFKFWAPNSPATKIASVGWSYCSPADTHNMPARPWTFSCLMVALLPSPVEMQLEMLLKL